MGCVTIKDTQFYLACLLDDGGHTYILTDTGVASISYSPSKNISLSPVMPLVLKNKNLFVDSTTSLNIMSNINSK